MTEVRFADDLHGWAFEPALWATSDGGATWRRQAPPGGGRLVLALAGDSDAAYAVVSRCRLNR
ncbi:MAG: glycosyl hydrolase, partial [Actinobacteria bacterium]